jgi:hypothetical protein
LGAMGNGQNAHSAIAGNAKSVRYAGTVNFENGQVKEYSNGSGTYVPHGVLRHQSSFNQARGFSDIEHNRNPLSLSPASKLKARQAANDAIIARHNNQRNIATEGNRKRIDPDTLERSVESPPG